MKKIEFIGASGVGKTTLFNAILEKRSKEAKWITPTEARIELAKTDTVEVPVFSPHALMKLLLKMDVFKRKQPFLSDHVLRTLENKILLESMNQYNAIIDLSLSEIVLDEKIEPFKKVSFIDFYLKLILHDILTIEEYAARSLIVYDDGLIHNSYAVNNAARFHQMLEKEPDLIQKVLPQGAVFCDLSAEDNLARRQNRIRKGKGHLLEVQESEKQLYAHCKESIAISNQIINILKTYNIPILHLDMNDPHQKNIRLFDQFINSFN